MSFGGGMLGSATSILLAVALFEFQAQRRRQEALSYLAALVDDTVNELIPLLKKVHYGPSDPAFEQHLERCREAAKILGWNASQLADAEMNKAAGWSREIREVRRGLQECKGAYEELLDPQKVDALARQGIATRFENDTKLLRAALEAAHKGVLRPHMRSGPTINNLPSAAAL